MRGANHLSLIGQRVEPKLIAKRREYGSWFESVGSSKSKRRDGSGASRQLARK
jgi:hypothetical protein